MPGRRRETTNEPATPNRGLVWQRRWPDPHLHIELAATAAGGIELKEEARERASVLTDARALMYDGVVDQDGVSNADRGGRHCARVELGNRNLELDHVEAK